MKANFIKGYAYLAQTYRDPKTGKSTSRNVESLGKLTDIARKHNVADPREWCREYARKLTAEQDAAKAESSSTAPPPFKHDLPDDRDNSKNYGYLFMQKIFYALRLDEACKYVSGKTKIEYKLVDALRILAYGMALWPSSASKKWKARESLLEVTEVQYHDILRSLDLLAENEEYIQRFMFRTVCAITPGRKLDFLYLDCTNFYCCIEKEDEDEVDEKGKIVAVRLRKNGPSKENKRKPIVGLAAVVDGDGIPVCFIVYPGNMNEQQIYEFILDRLHSLGLSGFTLCSDAGLNSIGNRTQTVYGGAGDNYLSVLSPRQCSQPAEKAWYIDPVGWSCTKDGVLHSDVNLTALDPENQEHRHLVLHKEGNYVRRCTRVVIDRTYGNGRVTHTESTFRSDMTDEEISAFLADPEPRSETKVVKREYKNGGKRVATITTYTFLERAMVTFSMAHRIREREKRQKKVDYAKARVKSLSDGRGPVSDRKNRYLKEDYVTKEGEVADLVVRSVDTELLEQDEMYDGFYVVLSSNRSLPTAELRAMNTERWMDEDLFRLGKTFFKVRPFYLSSSDRITGHLMVYFVTSTIITILLKLMNGKGRGDRAVTIDAKGLPTKEAMVYTYDNVLETLRGERMGENADKSLYTVCRVNNHKLVTGRLNDLFDMCIDDYVYGKRQLNHLVRQSKNRNIAPAEKEVAS